jgi:hypothetical protein
MENVIDLTERRAQAGAIDEDYFRHMDRIGEAQCILSDAIRQMSKAGIVRDEVVGVLRHAATEIEQAPSWLWD